MRKRKRNKLKHMTQNNNEDIGKFVISLVENLDFGNEMLKDVFTGTSYLRNLSLHNDYDLVLELRNGKKETEFVRFRNLPAEEVRFYVDFLGVNYTIKNAYVARATGESRKRIA